MDGKDLHIGDSDWGILPATAPLAIGTLTIAGMAMAFAREGSGAWRCRSSAKAVRRSANGTRRSTCAQHDGCRPCSASQNNQTALSTPVHEQSAVRVFADKAAGYGIPGHHGRRHRSGRNCRGVCVGGRAGARGLGPALIELVSHAHVWPCASRRHALSRQGSAARVGLPAARSRATRTQALRVLGGARSDSRRTPRAWKRKDDRARCTAIA